MASINYNLDKIEIYSVENEKYNISDLMVELHIYESILSPYMTGSLVLADSGANVIGNLPIQGMERIVISISTSIDKDTKYEYDFRVYSVQNRVVNGKMQLYDLKLITYEGLQNEALRVGKKLEGYGQEIVEDIMTNIFKTRKDLDFEPCKYKMKFIPSNKRPFDLIFSMSSKCISSTANPSATPAPSTTASSTTSSTSGGSSTPNVSSNTVGKLTGTAGYLFFETYDGFKFKSVDKLSSIAGPYGGDPIKGRFQYAPANTDNSNLTSTANRILDYSYDNEIDIFKKLRLGTYSSLIVFFNPGTGTYEEYVYSLNDTYSSMVHMGSADKIPKGQKELAEYPTRIMTQFIDHENFYNEEGTASPEARDGSSKPSPFPDWKKFYMAQSIGRMSLLRNQVLNITIPCNLSLRAGDKIEALLPNMSSQQERTTKKYDEEHSGVYLIQDISYTFKRLEGSQGTTTMKVVRDSYGMTDKASQVK